jgi:hypothetical protein
MWWLPLILPQGVVEDHHKCAACMAMLKELTISLDDEPAHGDLDLRAHLGSDGKRQGKEIRWQVSEARSIEIVEGLCNVMNQYYLDDEADFDVYERFDVSRGPMGASALRFITNRAEASQEAKELQVYCQKLVEEHEETLFDLPKNPNKDIAQICRTEAKLCTSTQIDKFAAVDYFKEKRKNKDQSMEAALKRLSKKDKKGRTKKKRKATKTKRKKKAPQEGRSKKEL